MTEPVAECDFGDRLQLSCVAAQLGVNRLQPPAAQKLQRRLLVLLLEATQQGPDRQAGSLGTDRPYDWSAGLGLRFKS